MIGLAIAGALLGGVLFQSAGGVVGGAVVGMVLHALDRTIRKNRNDPEHQSRKQNMRHR